MILGLTSSMRRRVSERQIAHQPTVANVAEENVDMKFVQLLPFHQLGENSSSRFYQADSVARHRLHNK
jgi:hypothetical protein